MNLIGKPNRNIRNMELSSRKRLRSDDEDASFAIQQKTLVNEKIVNSSDDNKLKQVHDKTVDILLKASRNKNTAHLIILESKAKPTPQQFILMANGEVQLRSFTTPGEVAMERRKSECCKRQTFVQAQCASCSLSLCEYCGYSCSGECGTYLCGSCVMLFDCGTSDLPLCEKCKFLP